MQVAEFRKNIRQALEAVGRGEEVTIERYDEVYVISKKLANRIEKAIDNGTEHKGVTIKKGEMTLKKIPGMTLMEPKEYIETWNELAKDKPNVPQIKTRNDSAAAEGLSQNPGYCRHGYAKNFCKFGCR